MQVSIGSLLIRGFSGEDDILAKKEISRVTEINLSEGRRNFIHMDEMEDGTWRLTYTKGAVDNFPRVKSFDILRYRPLAQSGPERCLDTAETSGSNPLGSTKGITVIELIMVIAVVGVIAAVLIPSFVGP